MYIAANNVSMQFFGLVCSWWCKIITWDKIAKSPHVDQDVSVKVKIEKRVGSFTIWLGGSRKVSAGILHASHRNGSVVKGTYIDHSCRIKWLTAQFPKLRLVALNEVCVRIFNREFSKEPWHVMYLMMTLFKPMVHLSCFVLLTCKEIVKNIQI